MYNVCSVDQGQKEISLRQAFGLTGPCVLFDPSNQTLVNKTHNKKKQLRPRQIVQQ